VHALCFHKSRAIAAHIAARRVASATMGRRFDGWVGKCLTPCIAWVGGFLDTTLRKQGLRGARLGVAGQHYERAHRGCNVGEASS